MMKDFQRNDLLPLQRPWKEALTIYLDRLGVLIFIAQIFVLILSFLSIFFLKAYQSVGLLVLGLIFNFFNRLHKKSKNHVSITAIILFLTLEVVKLIFVSKIGIGWSIALTSVFLVFFGYFSLFKNENISERNVVVYRRRINMIGLPTFPIKVNNGKPSLDDEELSATKIFFILIALILFTIIIAVSIFGSKKALRDSDGNIIGDVTPVVAEVPNSKDSSDKTIDASNFKTDFTGGYTIQLMAVNNIDLATKISQDLRDKKLEVRVQMVSRDGNIFYRIFVGNARTRTELTKQMDKLKQEGSSPIIVSVNKIIKDGALLVLNE